MARVITVASLKGGVGKTLISINLTFYLSAVLNKKTLYVPLDNQGGAAKRAFDIQSSKTLNGMFFNEEYEIQTINDTLDCLYSDRTIHSLDRTDFKEAFNFSEELSKLKSNYDFIVIDTPPGLGARVTAAILATDKIVCPVECESSSVEGFIDLQNSIVKLSRFNPKARVDAIVINKYKNVDDQKKLFSLLESKYPNQVIQEKIRDLQPIKTSMSFGRAVWDKARTGNHKVAASPVKSVIFKMVEGIM